MGTSATGAYAGIGAEMSTMTITIDMNKKCAECGKPGASGSGICMKCACKAMKPVPVMKSSQGKDLQRRYTSLFSKARGTP